jgi:hypothetical protein
MQQKLLKIVRTLETDYGPYCKVERDRSDCFLRMPPLRQIGRLDSASEPS